MSFPVSKSICTQNCGCWEGKFLGFCTFHLTLNLEKKEQKDRHHPGAICSTLWSRSLLAFLCDSAVLWAQRRGPVNRQGIQWKHQAYGPHPPLWTSTHGGRYTPTTHIPSSSHSPDHPSKAAFYGQNNERGRNDFGSALGPT
jgi:hypothetical protein